MATMFAVPPIQLPLSAASPFQASGSPMSWPAVRNAMGPPITIPSVPTSNMMSAILPRLAIAFRSMVSMRRKSAIGRRTYPKRS